MKQKLLFVLNNLNCGGAEKALISLLETLDYDHYEVDLFLFKHEGLFMNKIPKEVSLLPEPFYFKYFDLPLRDSIKGLIQNRAYQELLSRFYLGYLAKTEKNGSKIEQRLWKRLSYTLEKLDQTYDVAVGFQEKNPIYFCVDCVKAKKKIGWVHTDYNQLGISAKHDAYYVEKLDYLVTVSEELVNILRKNFPNYAQKMRSIHNIVSTKVIRNLALEQPRMEHEENQFKIVSVGRLAKEKGLDLSLAAVDLLVKKGHNIKWLLIGEGNVRAFLEEEIRKRRLEQNVKLLGLKENPYPYIKEADLYLQTSRFEGKSISIVEAKILAKPIVITNFETARDHIEANHNGLIAEMSAESIASQIERLIKDGSTRNLLMKNLESENFGTEDEIKKFYNLITM